MRLDGYGLFVNDMAAMIRFYRDVLGFEIKEAENALSMGMTFDAVTVSLEDAISELLELTGEKTSDEVIDRVFHNFCVGK